MDFAQTEVSHMTSECFFALLWVQTLSWSPGDY